MFRCIALVACMLAWSPVLWAQLFAPTSSNITPDQAQQLFNRLKTDEAMTRDDSECFQRAHLWSHLAEREMGIITDKVFLFFTYKFSMARRVTTNWGQPFTWWFHVAPAVRVNGELWALDATFSEKAMPVQQWARSLMKEPEDCVQMDRAEDYAYERNLSEGYRHTERVRNTCYMTTTPRFTYQPAELGLWEKNRRMSIITPYRANGWETLRLRWAILAYADRAYAEEVADAMGISKRKRAVLKVRSTEEGRGDDAALGMVLRDL